MTKESKQGLALVAIAAVLVAISFVMDSGESATQVFVTGLIAAVIGAVVFARGSIRG